MACEVVELCDEQDTFNDLANSVGDLEDLCSMLQGLGVEEGKLKGAVYGWALGKAGL